jgi:predicted MFS family arabinose efflux permease
LIWALAFSKSLIVLLPLVLLSSATWSSADLSLRSEVQRAVPERDQPRAMSFLYGSFVLGGALTSLALGAFIDALPLIQAIMWTCAMFSALAAGVFFASRKLKK